MATAVRTHHYIYDYQKLHDWFAIRIEDHPGSSGPIKKVFFTSRLHVTTEIELSWCYDGLQFSDHAILNDDNMVAEMRARYGDALTYADTLRSVGVQP